MEIREMGQQTSRAPDWETRKFLRRRKGRPTYWVTVTRLDPHAKNHKRARTTDPRGYDPLEAMRMNRGDAHPSLPESFHEHRVNAYVAAREVAMEKPYGFALLDAKAARIQSERRLDAAEAKMIADADLCASESGRALAAWINSTRWAA